MHPDSQKRAEFRQNKASCKGTAFLCALALSLLCSCASDDEESKVAGSANTVTDAVVFEVHGIDGTLRENVEKTLNGMTVISKKRARIFGREIRGNVQTSLHALGYYHPAIELTFPERDGDSNILKVDIDPGKPLFIRDCNVEILGEGAFYQTFQTLLHESGIESYAILDHGKYENLKSDLISKAYSLGFFDAKIVVSRIMVYTDENAADVEFIFDTGRRYKFGEMIADAETVELLKPSASLNTIPEGEDFSSQKLKDYTNSLSRTGYYRSIDARPSLDKKHDFEVPIAIDLERKKNNLMRVGAGFSTDEGVIGLISWDKPLLNESGHSLSTTARVSQVTQDAQMVYKIPRKNPNLDYYYIKLMQKHTDFNDTLSDLSHLSFHYVANDTGKWRRDYSLAAEYEDYEQGADEGYCTNIMPEVLLSRRESSGGIDPARGYSLSLDFTGGTKLLSDYNFFKFVGTYKAIFSPTVNTRVLVKLSQGYTAGQDSQHVPPSQRFFVGGDQTIRGYGYKDEAPYNSGGLNGGRYMSLGSIEFQFPAPIDNSRIAVFLDSGTACNDYEHADWLFGPGMGFRYISDYGIFKVDLAYGMQNDSGLKLHFSFGPEF